MKTYLENGIDKEKILFFSEFQNPRSFSHYIKMSSLIHRIFMEYLYLPEYIFIDYPYLL